MHNTAERGEVSLHEVRVVLALKGTPDTWLTNREISAAASVAERTARQHTLRLVKLGLIDQVQVFPGHRYKWSSKAGNRNAAYERRLQTAIEVFGLA
jgi:hypothetical protein